MHIRHARNKVVRLRSPRRSPLVAAAVAVVLAVVGSGPGADAKAVKQAFKVPASKVFTLQGHGYGHGHGMSQYGARGAAREGRTWQQILAFYYPGTALARTADEIRVLVTADTTADVVVSATAGLSARDLTTRAVHPLPTNLGATKWRLNPKGAGNNLAYAAGGDWHKWKALTGDAELFATGKLLTLHLPSGTRTYRGALRAAAPSKGSAVRDTVNVLSIDDYVRGVVPAEMPASWETEAVRAQTVAARSYAAWSRQSRATAHYQICDTTACQVYSGASREDSRSNAAVTATAGQILTYAGAPAFTQFSSSSGGWTSAGSVPYLVSKADPYETASGNPYTNWSVNLSAAAIQKAYPSIGTLGRVVVTEREGGGDWEGRVLKVTLDGTKADVVVSGNTFRSVFGLRSTYFTFGATPTSPGDTPILARWNAIGGASSPVGDIAGVERAIPGGRAQDFETGTIYWSATYGAWEVHGRILRKYQRMGESGSRLGLPVKAVERKGKRGWRLRTVNGAMYLRAGGRPIALSGPIAERYLALRGSAGELGWPTQGNHKVAGGNRADFAHGYIKRLSSTGRIKVVVR